MDAIEFDDLPDYVQKAIMAGVGDYARGDFVDFDIEDE